MTESTGKSVPVTVSSTTVRRRATIAVVGIPNCGKSTLFNRLTGLRQKTANYPGATVERTYGMLDLPAGPIELLDLPGTYTLGAYSPDEAVTTDALLGRLPAFPAPDAVLAVLDATNLAQSLYLLQQLLRIELPMVVALTMTDIAVLKGLAIDLEMLSNRLGGLLIIPVVGTTGEGLAALRNALDRAPTASPARQTPAWPELREWATKITGLCVTDSSSDLTSAAVERALIDRGGSLQKSVVEQMSAEQQALFSKAALVLFDTEPPQAVEARKGHRWARQIYDAAVTASTPAQRLSTRLLAWINSPPVATGLFLLVMAVVFQAVFAWATPVMDLIDGATTSLGTVVANVLGDNAFTSFLVDGVIAGVGSVVIFLPQILFLFLFIVLLEDTGYLARSAFLMDRVMRTLGLSGQSVIPMLSSFACAVPSIMATRVIPTKTQRLATILASPFMTCSARLPIYALLIAAFVPDQAVGPLNLQGLVLMGLYVLGMVGGAVTALLVNRFAKRNTESVFAMTLPEFRWPNGRTVLTQLLDRVRIFLRRAGTVIFTVAVIVWSLAYFPRLDPESAAALPSTNLGVSAEEKENYLAAEQLAQSWLGRAGRFVQPVFEPLGWDWRVSASVIAGFPAREVVVAVMGTIYAVGSDAPEDRLSARLRQATWPDGRRIFTLPMVLGLMVFYAWCLQCAATVAVIRRETNSWRWPIFSWFYMTSLGYLGALTVYQLGT